MFILCMCVVNVKCHFSSTKGDDAIALGVLMGVIKSSDPYGALAEFLLQMFTFIPEAIH